MNILSYSVKGDMLHVVTDNPGRPDFVYSADRFSTLEELSAEIERSIAAETARKASKETAFSSLSKALDDAGAVDSTPKPVEEL